MSYETAKKNDRGARAFAFVFLCLLSFAFLIPFLWIFLSALKVDMEISQAGGFLLLPKTWTLENFAEVLSPNNKQLPIYNWFINSVIISGGHTLLAVVIYSMSAYAYAKMKFKGRNTIFLTMMFLSSFPAVVNIVPMYKLMQVFKWINTPLAIIVPGLSGVFNIFLIRQFMYAIPDTFIESAKIDGANEMTVFTRIIVPLCRPILITVALFCFKANWNDFLWPSIAINNVERLTVTAGLQLALGVYDLKVAKTSAVAAASIIPMIVLYLFLERYFVQGVSLSSGVKG